MMSIRNTVKPGGSAPPAPSWTFVDCGDGVSRVSCDRASECIDGYAIGHGGDRGSLVYSVGERVNILIPSRSPLALKVYPSRIPENEIEFIRALFSNDPEGVDADGERECLWRQVPYLVLPLAIATIDGVDRGILMQKFELSLKQFLLSTRNMNGSNLHDKDDTTSSLRSCVSFEPIREPEVVTAIMLHLIIATSLLNDQLPHLHGEIPCVGFSHNDIHLENILLNRTSGCVALCDFELVGHIPDDGRDSPPPPNLHRLPPYCRQSPHGLFHRSTDTWALGILGVSLMTGVDPLFDDEKLMDDFGDGPLLQSYNESDGTLPVLDWETNIKRHVEKLLLRDDPSGQLLFDTQPLFGLFARCLVNRRGSSPSAPVDLLRHPLFSSYINNLQGTNRIVKDWVNRRYNATH